MVNSAAFPTAELYAIGLSLSLVNSLDGLSPRLIAAVRATAKPKAIQVSSKE